MEKEEESAHAREPSEVTKGNNETTTQPNEVQKEKELDTSHDTEKSAKEGEQMEVCTVNCPRYQC